MPVRESVSGTATSLCQVPSFQQQALAWVRLVLGPPVRPPLAVVAPECVPEAVPVLDPEAALGLGPEAARLVSRTRAEMAVQRPVHRAAVQTREPSEALEKARAERVRRSVWAAPGQLAAARLRLVVLSARRVRAPRELAGQPVRRGPWVQERAVSAEQLPARSVRAVQGLVPPVPVQRGALGRTAWRSAESQSRAARARMARA